MEKEWEGVQTVLAHWHQQYLAGGHRPELWPEFARQHLAEIVVSGQRHPALAACEEWEVVLLMALGVLGPAVTAPPAESWSSLRHLVIEGLPGRELERIVEMVIAWGCGWQRQAEPTSPDPWRQRRWQNARAIQALISIVAGSIRETTKKLRSHVSLASDTRFPDFPPEVIQSLANTIAMQFMLDRCDCDSHRRDCPDARSCRCCQLDHRLSQWRPTLTLRAYVAQAVRGQANGGKLKMGAFERSILGVHIQREFGWRIGTVEFKVCHLCYPGVSSAARNGKKVRLGDVKAGLYQGATCRCGGAVDRSKTYHLPRKHWFLLPCTWDGDYEPRERRKCSVCRNYFAPTLPRCPLCQGPATQRPTLLWVYQPRGAVRREQNLSDSD